MANGPSRKEWEERRRRPVGGGKSHLWIISGPFSIRLLVFWGVVIFIAGFLHGRQMRNTSSSVTTANSAAPPASPASASAINSSPVTTGENKPARVTVRMLKFSPESIEIKAGDSVEWMNKDLTPHTATSPDSGELNSGPINAGASWSHTFAKAGSFPYVCTFHPEMNGVVVVR